MKKQQAFPAVLGLAGEESSLTQILSSHLPAQDRVYVASVAGAQVMQEQFGIGWQTKGSMASRRTRGFSLLELMIVVAIMLIAVSISIMSLQPALRAERVTNAYNTTLSTMRRARELAIGQRRTYVVTFSAATPSSITITPASVTPGGLTATYTLPDDVSFATMTGLPAVAPDGFGTGATAIDFDQGIGAGNKNAVYFMPDGSAQDINNNTNNGVVYLCRPGELGSMRAITLWGATGRLRGWRIATVAGVSTWKQQ
jgi:prepilin-type N-terminal cleavage/methylation domain-containing protein